MNKVIGIFGVLMLAVMWMQCSAPLQTGIVVPDQPYERLSDYHFFNGQISDLAPVDGVLPYDLNSPLFSDYSTKARFVWMPDGTSAEYTTDHVLDFPVGAILIKNFYYHHDDRSPVSGRQLIETRLLINRGDQWDAYGYTWNDDQTDAFYDVVGDIKAVGWIDKDGVAQKVNYIIPNKNQCKSCHDYDNKLKPIGPKVRNINKMFAYQDGAMNQLDKWKEVGYLKNIPDSDRPMVATWDDAEAELHDRAMAYLDINCGHCHNPKGAGNTSGLTLLAENNSINSKLGVYKATVSAGAGTGGHTYSIVPGHPEESIMVYRMKSLNPGAMMPEVGRQSVHAEGVELISQWIKEMKWEGHQSEASLN